MKYLKCFFALVLLACFSQAVEAQNALPRTIESGPFNTGHIQGIAVDTQHNYIYMSYTTMLVKCDMQGNIVGSVTGLLGHLGDLDFNPADGRVYGSLEYKNDAIGKGILAKEKSDKRLDNAFYIAIFDVERITRLGMDAEKDGIMTSVYLPTVLEDYLAKVELDGKQVEHRLGCSGIDGVAFGPRFGKSDGKQYLTTTYGIYSDVERSDNDYQVILQYDVSRWAKYERPLSQDNMHTSGPAKPDGEYFAYTGNTSYGVQNLEYDPDLNIWWIAVYKGKKAHFPNYLLFAVDGSAKPTKAALKGVPYLKKGSIVSLWHGQNAEPITGWNFPVGSTGIAYLGKGYYYFSHNYKNDQGQGSSIKLYKYNNMEAAEPFNLVK